MPQIYLKDAIYDGLAEQIDDHRKSKIVDKIEEVVGKWLLEQTRDTKIEVDLPEHTTSTHLAVNSGVQAGD